MFIINLITDARVLEMNSTRVPDVRLFFSLLA